MTHSSRYSAPLLIWLGTLLLACLSLLSLRSVAPEVFFAQIIYGLIALILAVGISRLDYRLYIFSPWPWYGIVIGLLTLTYVFGETIRGATRWLNLFGVSLQTSELAKPLLILFLAIYVVERFPSRFVDLLRFILLLSLPVFLVFFQPDLGTAIIYAIIAFTGLVAAGIGFKPLLTFLIICLFLIPIFFPLLKPYQQDRLHTFLNQDLDPQGIGYNAHQAQIAVGSGKFFGRGLGQGTQSHLRFLPEKQTDFIFASIVEELGFLGGALIISAFVFLAAGLIQSSKRADTETGAIICLVSMATILLQAYINIGMNMGLLPVTGITLPFVSAGGSSLISLGIIIGICLSVALRPQINRRILEIR